jgi:dUTP pyrophosphatase
MSSSDLKRPASPHPDQRPSKVVNNKTDEPQVSAPAVKAPNQTLLIKRLNENARLPTRGSALAAGYDLYR